MTKSKKAEVRKIVEKENEVDVVVKGMKTYRPDLYRDLYADGGKGGWSRPIPNANEPSKKEERVTTEKGIEEMQNER